MKWTVVVTETLEYSFPDVDADTAEEAAKAVRKLFMAMSPNEQVVHATGVVERDFEVTNTELPVERFDDDSLEDY